MSIFDEAGQLDRAVRLTSCPHGKDGESCARCALAQVERDNRGPEPRPEPTYFQELAWFER